MIYTLLAAVWLFSFLTSAKHSTAVTRCISLGKKPQSCATLTTVTKSSGDDSYYSSGLRRIEERLLVRNFVNRLEIADGLKQLLLSKDFTFKSLLDVSALDLAEILGIDEYIAKIIIRAIKAAATKNPQNLMILKRNQYALQVAYFIGLTGVGYAESTIL